MNLNKHKEIMKAFISSQFEHCPVVWIIHSRRLNNRKISVII